MAAQELKCPNCGAPVDYDGSDVPTIRCPFCNTSVVIPAEMRPRPVAPVYTSSQVTSTVIDIGQTSGSSTAGRSRVGCVIGGIVGVVVLFTLGAIFLPLMLMRQANQAVTNALQPGSSMMTELPGVILTSAAAGNTEPVNTPTPAASPTPSFASLQVSFGSKGIGPGLLNDARYMAVDGGGVIYLADYMDGRVQAFDQTGKYLNGWQIGDENTIIDGLTANHDGVVFVAHDGVLERYDGSTGKLLGKINYANGPEFGDLAATADGGIIGVWYEGRWGMITSLEGHRDDLVWFDAKGKTLRTLKSLISGQTQELALDTVVAVNGLGTIYALSDGVIYKFTPQGKYLDKFPAQGDTGSDTPTQSCIAVNGQGQVFTAGSDQVLIYSADGRFIKSFKTEISPARIAFTETGDLVLLGNDQIDTYKLGALP
jgi:hypothetical protein